MNDFHWLNGLEEYFSVTDQEEKRTHIHRIKQSILDGNVYAIRQLVTDEVRRGEFEKTNNFIKLIMNQLFDEPSELTNRRVMDYISHCIDDDFIKHISSWLIQWGEKANLNDHFSRGQMKSKFWLISELNKLDVNPKNVVLLGGWYATIAYFLFYNWDDIEKIRNVEIDNLAVRISDSFNHKHWKQSWKFKGVVSDAETLKWYGKDLHLKIQNVSGKTIEEVMTPDMIINTSCEHMGNEWFNNLPKGTMVALQTNDYFSNEQHVNCVHDIEEALEKYKFSDVWYSGTLDTGLYNRFMIIGKK